MDRLDGKSMDLVSMNIEKLKKLFPEAVTEGRIDFEKLQLVLGENIEKRDERYEFTWNGKSQAIKLANKPSTGTLRPDKKSSKNWDSTENLYIEGDNLEVLKLLQKNYFNRVKMIYIDPPYNTGNDFVYHDDFRDNIRNYKEITSQTAKSNAETSGRYHTDWLNMMYPRLRLARNLLTDDGVIFISIDDNEVHNLRKICDEIFGEENFVAQVIVQVNKGGQDYLPLAKTHEYIICYFKSSESEINLIPKNDTSSFKFSDDKGKYELREVRNRNPKFTRANRPNLYYPIYINPNIKDEYNCCPVSLEKSGNYSIGVFPLNSEGNDSCWRWSRDLVKQNIYTDSPEKSGIVSRQRRDGGWNIYEKNRKMETKAKTIWDESEVRTERGTIVFRELFNQSYFDHPKPVELVYKAIQLATNTNDIILDFFSGSSTTAHAVMQLNAEDGGNRKFIMVQLPELCDEDSEAYKAGYKNICEIGKERIRRAGEKIKADNKDKEGIQNLDIGFKVFKLDSSNIKEWDADGEDLVRTLLNQKNSVKEDRNTLDLLYEVLIKLGLDLNSPVEEAKILNKKVFFVGMGYLIACFDENIELDLIDEIGKRKPDVVVFLDKSFLSDVVKTNAYQRLKRYGVKEIKSI